MTVAGKGAPDLLFLLISSMLRCEVTSIASIRTRTALISRWPSSWTSLSAPMAARSLRHSETYVAELHRACSSTITLIGNYEVQPAVGIRPSPQGRSDSYYYLTDIKHCAGMEGIVHIAHRLSNRSPTDESRTPRKNPARRKKVDAEVR